MQFKTLENLTITQLTNLFNRAFADYFVKIDLTEEILREKIQSEDIQLNRSVGMFHDEHPVGFVLHAVRNVNGKNVAYNAGTGIIPEFRGNHATIKSYRYIQPILLKSGVKKVVLEVMEQNIAAIKSYINCGFKKVKNLECFSGKVEVSSFNSELSFQKINNQEVLNFQNYWDWSPTWQHASATVIRSGSYETYGAHLNNKLVAYASFIPQSGRVAQFAVHPAYRGQGVGASIFNFMSNVSATDLSLINIDGDHSETLHFLKKMGLDNFLRQFKMELKFK